MVESYDCFVLLIINIIILLCICIRVHDDNMHHVCMKINKCQQFELVMSFEVEQRWSEQFPRITKPEVVGYFSLNARREYLPDLSQLKYVINPPRNTRLELNLNHGIENVIRKPESASEEKLNHLLKWIINNYSKIEAPPETGRWLKPEFICYRGLLSTLWRTPYEESEGWILCAVKFKGTIYLCNFDTKEAKQRKENATARDLMMCSWGFKFEQYILSDSPEKQPDVSVPVNESEEFCCIFSCEFGKENTSMLYGAEMDGINSEKSLEEPVQWKNVNFVELKTNRIIESYRQDTFFRKKLLRWWCQSFLVGVDSILCGFRTNDGKVIDLKKYKVSDLVKMAKNHWEAGPCMIFCDAFLSHMKTVVTEDYNKCIYKFTWRPGGKVEMDILNSELASGYGAPYAFLPQWYTEKAVEIIHK